MKYYVALAGASLALSSALPAHAVVLEQKWQAGQNLGYDLALDGAVNLQAPPDAPMMGGMPIEVAVKGAGKAQLQTLKVDPTGTGTVAFKVPQAQFNFETFGQKFQFNTRNGNSSFTWNGKAQNTPPGFSLAPLVNPTTAVKIGKDGRVRGFEPIQVATTKPAPAANDNATAATPARVLDQGALMTEAVLQALPALWPGRDVQPNETWQVKLDIPPALRPGGPTAENAPKSLGTFNMTLKGEEQVGAKKYWRVGVVGNIQVDGALWRNAGAEPGVQPAAFQMAPGGVQFDAASQRVEGDLWVDADVGQLVRAELALNSRAKGRIARPGGGQAAPSWVDFVGTLQLQLQPDTQ